MFKHLYFYLSCISLVFLASCHLIGKKDNSERQIASVRPDYKNPFSRSVSSKKSVSTIVLFQKGQPVCAISTEQYPRLAPSFFKVHPNKAKQKVFNSVLPNCNPNRISQIHSMTQQATLLDKNMSYKVAGGHHQTLLAVACLPESMSSKLIPTYFLNDLKREYTKQGKIMLPDYGVMRAAVVCVKAAELYKNFKKIYGQAVYNMTETFIALIN